MKSKLCIPSIKIVGVCTTILGFGNLFLSSLEKHYATSFQLPGFLKGTYCHLICCNSLAISMHMIVLVRVSIAMKRHHDHANSYKEKTFNWAGL